MLSLKKAFDELVEEYRSDYAIGTNSRFRPQPKGVASSGSGADYHYRHELQFLRGIERARSYDRNNMVIRQGVNRLVANVLPQDGFKLDPKTGDKEADKILKEKWLEWSTDPRKCDYTWELTYNAIARLAFRHMIVDGDCSDLPDRDTGSLRYFEAHRMRTPKGTKRNVICGVMKDAEDRRTEYWLTRNDVSPLSAVKLVREIKAFPAYDEDGHKLVNHHYFRDRFSQTRGVSAFAAPVDVIGMHDDIQFAALVKSQISNCFTIFEEILEGAEQPKEDQNTGSSSTIQNSDGTERVVEGVGPGQRVQGTPGMKLHGFSPNIPNPEFFPHALMMLTFIAINLDLPVAVLLLDPSNTNFSGWRGAMEQARMRFRVMQSELVETHHKPHYTWKVRQWLTEDKRLQSLAQKEGVNIFGHRFKAKGYGYIEPVKDATADLIRGANTLTSLRRLSDEKGEDWDDITTESVEDRALLIEKAIVKAIEINKKFPKLSPKVSWRELACLAVPDSVKVMVGYEKDNNNNDSNN
ncbi:MAG: phage portal protein [Planctomycetaceae bacterium]|nr:phage portal protein [Planctomycetaceae bacterium]